MSKALDFVAGRRLAHGPEHAASDIERICSIPVQQPLTDEEYELVNSMEVKPEAAASGFKLQRGQAEALYAYRSCKGLFAPLRVGAGKCVHGDVEVFDRASGRRRKMSDVGKGLLLDALHEDSLRMVLRESRSFASGWKRCVRVTLRDGSSIVLSEDHPVRTAVGWVEAAKLLPGVLVATPRALLPGQGLDVPDEEIRLLAYLLADGGLSQGCVNFCDEPGETVDDVLRCCARLGFPTTVRPERSKAVSVDIRKALPWTRKWGIQGTLSKDKRMPAKLYDMSRSQAAQFIGSFWACDGHVGSKGLECTLASEMMLRDIKHVLLYLGICCTLHPKKARIGGREYPAWRLVVSGEDAVRFLRTIKIPGQDRRVQEFLAAADSRKLNTNTDVVPISPKDCEWLSKASGLPRTTVRQQLSLTSGQLVGRANYEQFCHRHQVPDPLATSDLRWVKCASVSDEGVHEVFDASVDADHNFVANGIVIHNTLVSLRIVGIAFEQGIHRAAIFVPPQVHAQLVDHDIAWARRRVNLGLTFFGLGNKTREKRAALAGGRRGCWIFPYSLLSAQDASELLEKIRPELMIFDEAHMLKHRTSARTKRIWSYWKKYRPQVVTLSGTMTGKSLREFAHLLTMSLREGAPVPMDAGTVNEWANVIDSDQAGDAPTWRAERGTSAGPLRPLINWCRENFPQIKVDFTTQGFRNAFQNRLVTTPGVVSSPADELGTSLLFENTKLNHMASPGGAEMQRLLDDLDRTWLSPDGDEIEHAMVIWKWKNEITSGIYNSLTWPTRDAAAKRGISIEILERSMEYHALRQHYHKTLRQWFANRPHRIGMDTPFLVGRDMAAHGAENVGRELYEAWNEMRAADFEGRIERDSRPVRVCDYKVREAVRMMQERSEKKGIVWFYHQEIGRWISELAEEAGIGNAVYCPAGKEANEFLADPKRADDNYLICSLSAHGTGKNLQFVTDQIFVQLPISEQRMEQAVGRTHRRGQRADLVTCHTMISNTIDEMALAAHLNDATYVFETTGESRKLLSASWNPVPTVYASDVLVRAGIQAKRLNARQQMLLKEKYE